MKRISVAIGAMVLFAAASAQQGDPALDNLGSSSQSAPGELDILSAGTQSDFPDIDAVKARKPISVTLRALNKVTAKYSDIVIKIGETAKYGSLELTPRYCDKRPPEEFPETTAFVEIVDTAGAPKSDFKVPLAKAEPADAEPAAVVAGSLASSERQLPEGMIFSGWMFASSPALNGVEHAVYDVWVIDCKTVNIDN